MCECTNLTANEQPDDVSADADTNVVIEQLDDVPIEKWNLSKNLI